ncbi:hypothetical protein D3C81_791100 [compost metagenome]
MMDLPRAVGLPDREILLLDLEKRLKPCLVQRDQPRHLVGQSKWPDGSICT